jgi:hypothetical protein
MASPSINAIENGPKDAVDELVCGCKCLLVHGQCLVWRHHMWGCSQPVSHSDGRSLVDVTWCLLCAIDSASIGLSVSTESVARESIQQKLDELLADLRL